MLQKEKDARKEGPDSMALNLFRQRTEKPIDIDRASANDFRGEWLAILDNKIIAHNSELAKVMGSTRGRYSLKKVKYARVPLSNIAMY